MKYLVADGMKEKEARKSVCWRGPYRLYQTMPE